MRNTVPPRGSYKEAANYAQLRGSPNACSLSDASSKDRVTAGVLAILLGDWVSQVLSGKSRYRLFVHSFLLDIHSALIALIEGIVYLTMDDASFSLKYNVKS